MLLTMAQLASRSRDPLMLRLVCGLPDDVDSLFIRGPPDDMVYVVWKPTYSAESARATERTTV